MLHSLSAIDSTPFHLCTSAFMMQPPKKTFGLCSRQFFWCFQWGKWLILVWMVLLGRRVGALAIYVWSLLKFGGFLLIAMRCC